MKHLSSLAGHWRRAAKLTKQASITVLLLAVAGAVLVTWVWSAQPPAKNLDVGFVRKPPSATAPSDLVALLTDRNLRSDLSGNGGGPKAPTVVQKPPPNVEVVAIMAGPESEPRAFVRDRDTHKLKIVTRGSHLGDYIVTEIAEGRVVVTSGAVTQLLTVRRN